MIWQGKVTEELIDLYKQYHKLFPDGYPDEYEEIEYYAMTYNEFIIGKYMMMMMIGNIVP